NPPCSNGMDEEHVLFNVSLNITEEKGKDIFTEYATPPLFKKDLEEKSLDLLYRNRKTYAVGHGCSANWERDSQSENAKRVFSEAIPTFEVPQVDFDIPGLESETLSMLFLSSDSQSNEEVIDKLLSFCELYKDWISKISNEKIPDSL